MTLAVRISASLAIALLAGCAGDPVGVKETTPLESAWVELGPRPQVRAVVPAGSPCPTVSIDGRSHAMTMRVAADTAAARPTVAQPSKASVFDVGVCEADLDAGAREIHLAGLSLPGIRQGPMRILVLGDTGCRLNGATSQRCNDPTAWPFSQVAAAAAAMTPDLVIHVGDYHYRELPCPSQLEGCRNSPWGYGWDAWRADFFEPARPLLRAAPWVFVRGNHEECARAGQGWFRFLAPERFAAERSCDDAGNDDSANYSEPYAIPLGRNSQLIVFDSAVAGNLPLRDNNLNDKKTRANYLSQARTVSELTAAPIPRSWFASHHPVLAFAPDSRRPESVFPGNPALQTVLREVNGAAYYPDGVQLALHGHVHLFQAISFSSKHVATLVAGHGGDTVDADLPVATVQTSSPAPGVRIEQIAHSSGFGFLMLQRVRASEGRWTVQAYRVDGSLLTQCDLPQDGQLACSPSGWLR